MKSKSTQVQVCTDGEIPLGSFRRRIRVLRAWRLGAMCGIVGAGAAVVMALLDMMAVVYFEPWMLAAFTLLGVLVGVSRGLTEPLPYESIAGSVDRRAGLADRVLTAKEIAGDGWSDAVHDDAIRHLDGLDAGKLYPIRFGRWQGVFLSVALVASLIWIGANTSLFRTAQQRKEAAELKAAAVVIQQVIKPVLEAANTQNATPEDRDLARELNKFAKDLEKGRVSKADALIKANDLAEKAEHIEQTRDSAMNESLNKTQTAKQEMEKLAGLNSEQMQSMSPAEQQQAMNAQASKLSQQESSIQQQMDAIQKQLDSGKSADGKTPLTPKMSDALRKQMAELQKMMQSIKLSQQALDFMNKLAQQPDYQKAMQELQKLMQNQQAKQNGEQPPMTREQMEQAAKALQKEAKELEELAKKYDTDGKIAELAKEMMEAAQNAGQGKNGNPGPGLMAAMGMPMPGMPGSNMSMGPHSNGPSPPGSDLWNHSGGLPPMSDKSSLLKAKYQDRVITSQIGSHGDQTYVEVTGPSMPTGKTSVPYQQVLPKYEKTAETALNHSDIPPSERAKVRSYFDSLHTSGQ